MSGTEWFCGVQLGGVKLPAEFPAARNSKSMVHAGTGRWRQKNGRPMLIVGSRLAVYRMAVLIYCHCLQETVLHSTRPTDGQDVTIRVKLVKVLPHAACSQLYNVVFRR